MMRSMRNVWIVVCLVSSLAYGDKAAPKTSSRPVEKVYAQASALMDRSRYKEALPLLLDAAARGLDKAQHQLGYIYEGGEPGIPKDLAEAARWYTLAAAQGYRASQFTLGQMYDYGTGVTQDRKKAYELYLASAKQKFGLAEFTYGLVAEINLDDRKAAIYWLTEAGKQGDGRARWIAEWLRRSDTPHFDDEAKLGAYINGKVAAWMASSSRGTAAAGDFSYTKYVRERTRQMYQSGDTAAADRCAYNGRCF